MSIWLDSTDLPRENHAGWSKKDPDFSYKLNRLGRRYMVLRNAPGKILCIWGGYSPKLHDGHFIELIKRELNTDLKGAEIIADQHFAYGQQFLPDVTLWTPPKEPSSSTRGRRGEGLGELTKEQRKYKQDHQALRARVENVLGLITQKFTSLAEPWAESERQQDHAMLIAAAVHNNNM